MRSRVVPGRSSTMAMRSPTRRLKRVDLPTFGRPTIATSGRVMPALRRDRDLVSECLDPLLHFDQRVHRRGASTDEPDALLAAQPRGLHLVGGFDVIRVAP